MRLAFLGLTALSLALTACLFEQNQVGPPPLQDPGRPAVGSRCGPETEPVVPNAGCRFCRESFLVCVSGIWDCADPVGGAACTPLPPADAASDAGVDAAVSDAMADAAPESGADVRVDRASDVSDAATDADAAPAADRPADAVVPDASVSPYACPMDSHPEGSPCRNYAGACARDGAWRCDALTGLRRCVSPPAGQPTPEVCDGLDNDCDGLIDEGIAPTTCYSGPPSTSVRGTCRLGLRRCLSGRLSDCEGEVLPRGFETCGDGLDNDCDGQVDQGCCGTLGFAPDPCARGIGTCRRSGVLTCASGQIRCSVVAGTPVQEICANGADDDCDGITDESPCVVAPPP